MLSPLAFRFQGETIYRVEYELDHAKDAETSARSEQQIANVFTGQAQSQGFVWKPWFSSLVLNGSGSFNHTSTTTNTDDERTDSRSLSLSATGDAGLTLYPGSRFPFNVTVRHSETYSDSDGQTDRQFSDEFSLSQDYRPLNSDGPTLRADFDHRTSEDENSLSTDDAFRFRVNQVLGEHRLNGNFEWLLGETKGLGASPTVSENESVALFGDHSVFLGDEISVNSFGSMITTTNGSTGSGEQQADIWQLVNNVRWAPLQYDGLDLRADTRVSGSEQGGLASSEQFGFNNRLGADYRFTDNLDANAQFETDYRQVDGVDALNFREGAGVRYRSDELLWGEWSYRWNASSQGGYNHGDGGSSESLSASLSHSLRQQGLFFDEGTTSMVLRQRGSFNAFVAPGQAPITVTHLANFSWRLADEDVSDYLFINFADDRDVGGETNERQQLNIQLERDQNGRGGERIETDLVGELLRTQDGDDEAVSASLNGEMEYTRNHLWKIPNLNYRLNFKASMTKDIKNADGEAGDVETQMSVSNSLGWGLGRLLVQLRGNLSVSETGENLGVFLEVRRFWAAF